MPEELYESPEVGVEVDYRKDEAMRIWHHRAIVMAEQGKSEMLIVQFLISKGVKEGVAQVAVKDIYANQTRKSLRRHLPFCILGWFLIAVGFGSILIFMLRGGGLVFFGLGPLAVGCYFVFGLCKGENSRPGI